MIMYSVIPLEQIFEGIENETSTLEEINIHGMIMEVQPIDSRQARIVRLISPNPQDYLNPAFAPGQIIYYTPSM